MSTPRTTPRPHAPPGADPAPEAPTRARIVEAARRLFHEQGYHATGIATILREAQVNAGSLYHFFPSKEALLAAVLEKYVDMLGPELIAPVERQTADPIERVFTLLGLYRAGLEMTQCSLTCPIGALALEVGGGYPEVRRLINLNFENWAARVKGWLDAAGERLPPDVDRGALARFVLTVMEGGMMQARAAGSMAPFDESVAGLRGYFARLSGTPDSVAARGRARTVPRASGRVKKKTR